MDNITMQTYQTGSIEEINKLVSGWDMYPMIRFKDHVSEFPDVRIETDLGNGLIKHDIYEGQIYQAGTDLDAENLGHMDLFLYALWLKHKELLEYVQHLTLQVVALKGAAINNMPNNIFFANASDFAVIDGWHDVPNKRVVAV
ncbi:MAG: hypothetical protein GXZ11_05580 [Tissierellia bacterium]|nr:hypothetical protein [Tissierellia bacterium]